MPIASPLGCLLPSLALIGTRLAHAGIKLPLLIVFLSGASHQLAAADQPAEGDDEYAARIYIGNADGSALVPLTSQPGYSTQGSPDWSQDGKLIGFDTWKLTKGENYTASRIAVVNADGTNPRILGDGAMPSFSPRGHRIAFSRTSDPGVWVMSSEGPDKELVLLDERGWGTDWSPDGTRIAYAIHRGGANLVVYNLVEGTRTLLFEEGASSYRRIYWNFVWSGDGQSIAFKAVRLDGKSELAVVDARGANHGLKRVFEGDLLPALAWSPDSKQILLSLSNPERDNLRQLFSIDPAGSGAPTLLPELEPTRQYRDMAFSPDGKKIAVLVDKPGQPE